MDFLAGAVLALAFFAGVLLVEWRYRRLRRFVQTYKDNNDSHFGAGPLRDYLQRHPEITPGEMSWMFLVEKIAERASHPDTLHSLWTSYKEAIWVNHAHAANLVCMAWDALTRETLNRVNSHLLVVGLCVKCSPTFSAHQIAEMRLSETGAVFHDYLEVAEGTPSPAIRMMAVLNGIKVADSTTGIERIMEQGGGDDDLREAALERMAELETNPRKLAQIMSSAKEKSRAWYMALDKLSKLNEAPSTFSEVGG